jgi:hypothetical protein
MVKPMNALSLNKYLPWSLRSMSPFLNKYGDGILFRAVSGTPPIAANPEAETGIHSAVPHRYLYAYLTAIKSFLRYYADIAVYVHDDGSLREEDKALIRRHVPGVEIIDRSWADQAFADRVGDEFLMKVRKSYTSYLKLFDPTLVSTRRRIIIVDTDVLFLAHPSVVIDWAKHGGAPWYHKSEPWRKVDPNSGTNTGQKSPSPADAKPTHIQQLVVQSIPDINHALNKDFAFVPGFNSGFIGYEHGTVNYGDLKQLLSHLYGLFGDRIFRWGAEQTTHGMVLCGQEARALTSEDYMVFTNLNSDRADKATFIHFIGEFRYHRLKYPRMAAKVISQLKHCR